MSDEWENLTLDYLRRMAARPQRIARRLESQDARP